MLYHNIPDQYVVTEYPEIDAVVGIGEKSAIAYSGKGKKADFHFRFCNNVQRDLHVSEYIERMTKRAKEKAAEEAARKAYRHDYKVGEILKSSWGYEQTNVDFYQVVAVPSNKSIVIREIARSCRATGDMTGETLPVPDSFKSEPMRFIVRFGGYISIKKYAVASRWDRTPAYYSTYA